MTNKNHLPAVRDMIQIRIDDGLRISTYDLVVPPVHKKERKRFRAKGQVRVVMSLRTAAGLAALLQHLNGMKLPPQLPPVIKTPLPKGGC